MFNHAPSNPLRQDSPRYSAESGDGPPLLLGFRFASKEPDSVTPWIGGETSVRDYLFPYASPPSRKSPPRHHQRTIPGQRHLAARAPTDEWTPPHGRNRTTHGLRRHRP